MTPESKSSAVSGVIFDIKEFALNDGDGIRTTVFFKGCPLRCAWCHNPEGLDPRPELYIKQNGCLDCGLCRRGCSHPECRPFGRCLHICPKNLVTVKGEIWEASALANRLLRGSDLLRASGGGVTLSGGEPLLQADFAAALLDQLSGKVHLAIETSGYADPAVFQKVITRCDFVYMDLKLADPTAHKRWTNVSNERILANARWLKESGIPHTFRTPLIPNIVDTPTNLAALQSIVGSDAWEHLPNNTLAPAKYKSVGREWILPIANKGSC